MLTAFAAGCIESTTVVKLNKNGSGTIAVEEFFSQQLTQMMEMGGQMAAGAMGATNAGAAKAVDQLAMFNEAITKKAEQLGDVKLVSKTAKNNAAGWKGYLLTYSFTDINKVKIAGGGDPNEAEGSSDAWKCQFKAGSPAVLTLGSDAKPKTPDAAAPAAPAEAGAPEGMDAAAMQMMGPMFAGMHIQVRLEVDGKITKTNAEYPSADGKSVTLMDLTMDKLISNPAAMKLMQAKGPDQAAKLKALKIEGIKIEDPSKKLSVEFN